MNPRMVIITCGGKKAGRGTKAELLYTGSFFRKQLAAAKAVADISRIRIISAKHGLLRLGEWVAPYDMRISDPGSVSAATLATQLADAGVGPGDTVAMFGARGYAERVRAAAPAVTVLWLPGQLPNTGMGYQSGMMTRYQKLGRFHGREPELCEL